MRVLLVSMPWHALDRPSLGLSLLKAALERDGHHCDVRYLGFDLADSIGLLDYQWVHGELPYTAFAGDWLFTRALYGERRGTDEAYCADVLAGQWQRSAFDVARLLSIRSRIDPFLDHCELEVADDYDIVGFTSTFEQNIASLALGLRLSRREARPLLVFGGANWEGEMGVTLHRQFDWIDASVTGEGDVSFPAYVRAVAAGEDGSDVPGLTLRGAKGETVSTGPAELIRDLDRLPVPRYDDYLAQLDQCAAARGVLPTLLLETSRGCWWGAKHHCTFCGLNGTTMQFRSKSAGRVLDEIDMLSGLQPGSVAVVDNILDMRYFKTVLPELARRGAPLRLFYEVKANLSLQQVRLLALAGVGHIQPGIESLSDEILHRMRKGTTALQNIQLLKWCNEFGITPEWNFLYGFPGEDRKDYDAMCPLIRRLAHLTPPSGYGPVRLDRFSPYHEDPHGLGITSVRPSRPYQYLYETDPAQLMQIAYYFDFEYADDRGLDYANRALQEICRWQSTGPRGQLTIRTEADGSGLVLDSRDGNVVGRSLEPWQADVLLSMDGVAAEAMVLRSTAQSGVTRDQVLIFLAACEELALVAHVGDRWLSLAVHDPPRWDQPVATPRPLLEMV